MLNDTALNVLSALTMLGFLFIFVGMPMLGIVVWFQSRKRRLTYAKQFGSEC